MNQQHAQLTAAAPVAACCRGRQPGRQGALPGHRGGPGLALCCGGGASGGGSRGGPAGPGEDLSLAAAACRCCLLPSPAQLGVDACPKALQDCCSSARINCQPSSTSLAPDAGPICGRGAPRQRQRSLLSSGQRPGRHQLRRQPPAALAGRRRRQAAQAPAAGGRLQASNCQAARRRCAAAGGQPGGGGRTRKLRCRLWPSPAAGARHPALAALRRTRSCWPLQPAAAAAAAASVTAEGGGGGGRPAMSAP